MLDLVWVILWLSCSTGLSIRDPPLFVINGLNVGFENYPFFAVLVYIKGGSFCGGALIKEDIVLTAAHCLDEINFKVYVGITTIIEEFLAESHYVEDIKLYPKYQEKPVTKYDVGLVKLKKTVTLSPSVTVIDIASDYPPIGAQVAIMGFGKDACDSSENCDDAVLSIFLKFAIVDVIQGKENGIIYTKGDSQNTCYGDSGGPIVYNKVVVGVVSSGQFNNCSGYDTQTPTSPYYSWIRKHMEEF